MEEEVVKDEGEEGEGGTKAHLPAPTHEAEAPPWLSRPEATCLAAGGLSSCWEGIRLLRLPLLLLQLLTCQQPAWQIGCAAVSRRCGGESSYGPHPPSSAPH